MSVSDPIRVLVLEDDPYARDMIGMLLRRDWRTSLVAEIDSPAKLKRTVKETVPDVIVADLDAPSKDHWLNDLFSAIRNLSTKPILVCLSLSSHPEAYGLADITEYICAYLVKEEIHYSLSWAIVAVVQGNFVCTPLVEEWAARVIKAKKPLVVMEGAMEILGLSPRQAEIAILGILYNLSRRDIADEIQKSEDLIYRYVSMAYRELGLNDGQDDLELMFENETMVLDHIRQSLSYGESGILQLKDKDTIAFHILTAPIIQ